MSTRLAVRKGNIQFKYLSQYLYYNSVICHMYAISEGFKGSKFSFLKERFARNGKFPHCLTDPNRRPGDVFPMSQNPS